MYIKLSALRKIRPLISFLEFLRRLNYKRSVSDSFSATVKFLPVLGVKVMKITTPHPSSPIASWHKNTEMTDVTVNETVQSDHPSPLLSISCQD